METIPPANKSKLEKSNEIKKHQDNYNNSNEFENPKNPIQTNTAELVNIFTLELENHKKDAENKNKEINKAVITAGDEKYTSNNYRLEKTKNGFIKIQLNTANKLDVEIDSETGQLLLTTDIYNKPDFSFNEKFKTPKTVKDEKNRARLYKFGNNENMRIAVKNDLNAPYYMGEYSANDKKLNRASNNFLKKNLNALDPSAEKTNISRMSEKLHDNNYSAEEQAQLHRIKSINENTLEKKEQLKINVLAKTQSFINNISDNTAADDSFFFFNKKRTEDTSDLSADENNLNKTDTDEIQYSNKEINSGK